MKWEQPLAHQKYLVILTMEEVMPVRYPGLPQQVLHLLEFMLLPLQKVKIIISLMMLLLIFMLLQVILMELVQSHQ